MRICVQGICGYASMPICVNYCFTSPLFRFSALTRSRFHAYPLVRRNAFTLSRFHAYPRILLCAFTLSRVSAYTLILLCASWLFSPAACAAPVTKTVVILKQAAPADNISAKNTRARFRVEVVTEKEDKHKGLSNRDSLPADAGMLFVLGPDDSRFFWMNGMNFPIDIIVIDRSMRVAEIIRDLQPCTQCTIYRVSESAAYALEINAGLGGKYGIAAGDHLVIKE